MSKLSRRTVLRTLGLGATAAMTARVPVLGRQGGNGAHIFLDMTQEELNAAYSQSDYAPNAAQVISRYRSNSELARQRLGSPRRFSYGERDIEAMDVFPAATSNAPIHVFVHGGAWQQGTAAPYAFLAETFVGAGIHFVALDFSLVQDVGDSLYPIADQLRRAMAWIYENAEQFDGDRDRIFISGHSSGAHLAGVLLTTDWSAMSLPADVIKGGVCCSGIYDLEPVRLSHRGEYIAFTDAMEHDLSPIRHIEYLNAPVVVAYGSRETREFQRHSRDFAAAINAAGKPVELVVAEHYNHFEVIETMASPYGVVGQAALTQVFNTRS